MVSDLRDDETESAPATDGGQAQGEPSEEGVDRRRLIRWIAVLAFVVPVVVELITFGGLIGDKLLPGGDDDGAASTTTPDANDEDPVGIGDELLPETAASETVVTSEVRGDPSSDGTYVLRVAIENTTEAAVELRLTQLRLNDGATQESVSSSGSIAAGEDGELTAAWTVPGGSMPDAVEVVALQGGETVVSRFVELKRPPIRG